MAKLDFSAWDDLRTPEQTPSNALERRTDERQYITLDSHKKAREMAIQAYGDYQVNIRASEDLRAQLMRGLSAGENHTKLLVLALRCIGKMTDDRLIMDAAEKMKPAE